MEIQELIVKLEQAARPDRELDALIHDVLGFESDWPMEDDPSYTSSIDAAMTLVPEGWSVSLMCSEGGVFWLATMGRSYPTNARADGQNNKSGAIALCIAALKARSVR